MMASAEVIFLIVATADQDCCRLLIRARELEGAQVPIAKSAFEKRVRGVGGMLTLKILKFKLTNLDFPSQFFIRV